MEETVFAALTTGLSVKPSRSVKATDGKREDSQALGGVAHLKQQHNNGVCTYTR